MRVYFPLLWVFAGCTFSSRHHPQTTAFVSVDDYRYFPPCGYPAYSDTLPAGNRRGEFNVYVLEDSASVNNCLAPLHRPRADGFPMRYGKDFVLVVEMKDAPGWGMELKVEDHDGWTELRFLPVNNQSTRNQYLWHFAADRKEVLRLTGSNGRFAYAKGPAWKAGKQWVDIQRAEGR